LTHRPARRDSHHIQAVSGVRESYQGMPSGVPNRPERKGGFSRCFMAIPTRRANPANVTAGARTFFVTSSVWGKQNLLQSDRAAGLFLRVLYDYRAQNKFRLHDFVVMPDHIHLLLTVGSENTIERAVQSIKGGFSFRAGKELGTRSPVWQKDFLRFESQLLRDFSRFGPTSEIIR
jgi:REP-associated tyrosine transposase